MEERIKRTIKILAPGASLKRRVGYALAIVRLILAPVILLTIYYLFVMGSIVNRIVNIDAPATTLAEQVSVEMLQARRNEHSYFLLHDPGYLQTNRQAIDRIKQLVAQIDTLEPTEQQASQELLQRLQRYQQQFAAAVALLEEPGSTTTQRAQQAVSAYEADLNDLLRHSKQTNNAELVRKLQSQVQSFDADIVKTLGKENPTLRTVMPEIQITSEQILQIASQLEARSWERVQRDHEEARYLVDHAEWVLGSVSVVTFILSVWISFVLPRKVVEPLVNLREAVDHAASGNDPAELELQGEGEIIELARSIDKLIDRLR